MLVIYTLELAGTAILPNRLVIVTIFSFVLENVFHAQPENLPLNQFGYGVKRKLKG